MGIASGHIADEGVLSLVMFVGLVTIIGSTYMTIHNGRIYKQWKKWFGDDELLKQEHKYPRESFDVILFGFGRM
ncbi:MAG: hypothetical protein H6765_02015 [Candidatus Peribacteria bacterium]|nr:MAG: hypothetical protein H6765_02015 [Candidatus Peribacteria bacterium]